MDEMFFELLYIIVILYLKNLFFKKMANPNKVFFIGLWEAIRQKGNGRDWGKTKQKVNLTRK